MPTKNTIRRNYLIIRRILQNDYPSKRTLLDYMKRYDVEIGERTFQRDLADIRSNFDIEIIYDEQKNGYYAQTDSTFDFDKLLYFILYIVSIYFFNNQIIILEFTRKDLISKMINLNKLCIPQ